MQKEMELARLCHTVCRTVGKFFGERGLVAFEHLSVEECNALVESVKVPPVVDEVGSDLSSRLKSAITTAIISTYNEPENRGALSSNAAQKVAEALKNVKK